MDKRVELEMRGRPAEGVSFRCKCYVKKNERCACHMNCICQDGRGHVVGEVVFISIYKYVRVVVDGEN